MKKISAIIPEKCDGPPITLSIPKPGRLDRLAMTLIGAGIGIALTSAISSLLVEEEETPGDDENAPDPETDAQSPSDQ